MRVDLRAIAGLLLPALVASLAIGLREAAAEPLCARASTKAELDARLEGRGCAHVEAEGSDGRERVVAGELGPGSPGWSRLVEADAVLLGEVHDNAGHHRRRAELIRQIVASRAELSLRRTGGALVMEQLGAEQRPALEAFYAGRVQTSAELFRLVAWDKSGWSPQALYAPLIETALALSLTVRAGDPSRALVRAVAKMGLSALGAEERAALGLASPLEPGLVAALDAELANSHCGVLPASAVAGMAAAQRYRDATLAQAVADALAANGAVFLVAGNGHVRRDRGVPWYLARRAPPMRIATVLLVEVPAGATDAAPLLPRDPAGRPAADLVILTAPGERPDPCAAMLEMKRRKPAP